MCDYALLSSALHDPAPAVSVCNVSTPNAVDGKKIIKEGREDEMKGGRVEREGGRERGKEGRREEGGRREGGGREEGGR